MSESRAALDQLLDTIREVADRFAGPEWGIATPDDTAGALRVLANLLEGGLVGHFDDDPRQPVFRQIVTSTRKSMGDNADAIYFDASVSSKYAYRVRGRTAGAVYLSFTVEAGAADGGFPQRTAGVLNDTQFDVDADGRFEIYLGGEERDRSWIALDPDASQITTRHYWEEERSPALPPIPDVALEIEVLDDLPPLPPPNDSSVAAGLRRVERYVRSRSLEQPKPGEGDQPAFVSREPNVFPKPVTPGTHALAAFDAAYSMAPYVLAPDEALVITEPLAGVPVRQRVVVESTLADVRLRAPARVVQSRADEARTRRLVHDGDRARRPRRAELARHRTPPVRHGVLALLPS